MNLTDYLPYSIYRISGHSMEPTIKMGSKVLVFQWAYLFKEPKIGDVIIFKKGAEYWIKRIKSLDRDEIEVEGDNKEDSMKTDLVGKKNLVGRAIGY